MFKRELVAVASLLWAGDMYMLRLYLVVRIVSQPGVVMRS